MPIYECPKCGRTVELPEGTYYCKECGPSAIMQKIEEKPRRYGKPRTEEERRARHLLKYGTASVPPRGTGLRKSMQSSQSAEVAEPYYEHYKREKELERLRKIMSRRGFEPDWEDALIWWQFEDSKVSIQLDGYVTINLKPSE